MKIIEKLQNGWYLAMPSGQYNRIIIHANENLEVGEEISINENKKDIDVLKTLCALCIEIFGNGEEYDEPYKQAAIDYTAGYSTIEEIKNDLNINL